MPSRLGAGQYGSNPIKRNHQLGGGLGWRQALEDGAPLAVIPYDLEPFHAFSLLGLTWPARTPSSRRQSSG